MKFNQIRVLEKNEREQLWDILEGSNMFRKFDEELNLDNNHQEMMDTEMEFTNSADIFTTVTNSAWFGKAKKRYTPEYLNNLKELMRLFLLNHQEIRQILRIPKASFRRLRLEIKEENTNWRRSKRFYNSHPELPRIEQIFISRIVEPPTVPMTLGEI